MATEEAQKDMSNNCSTDQSRTMTSSPQTPPSDFVCSAISPPRRSADGTNTSPRNFEGNADVPIGDAALTGPVDRDMFDSPSDMPYDETDLLSETSMTDGATADDSVCSESDVIISLDTVPVEILLHICDFLEAGVIINTLTKVCQAFQILFTDEIYWRTRMARRWPRKYPPVPYEVESWQDACVERERSHRAWSDSDEHYEHFTFSDNLFAAVDVVHLMQNGSLLAAGSRDRYLTLLNLTKYDSQRPETKKEMKLHSINKAHTGWIWCMASLDSYLYTGSWDTRIKVWDLEREMETVSSYKCKSAVLDLHVEENFLVAGAFDRKVYFLDPRQGNFVAIKRWHRQPVLCVAGDDRYIVTGSEDKTFSVYDRRAAAVFKVLQMESYPLDASYHSNQLWFGDKDGQLNLIDTSLGKFELVQRYNIGHTDKMTGVVHTQGAIFTASNDSSIRVLEPSLEPQLITSLQKHSSGVAGIDYQNGVLASAGCDITVGIWRPKNDWGWKS
ncbi:hypothetical protein BaRGS_00012829 [Batillaria attramentaria]|uniref:F-box domain-containing protein n=1 Tax=Batillaria attramentaria TaxID=370345 RepID=A0ABD0L8F2_9CAEN